MAHAPTRVHTPSYLLGLSYVHFCAVKYRGPIRCRSQELAVWGVKGGGVVPLAPE